jgi:hypothetical protein
MKYFVQLKDGVVFNFHSSSTEVDIPGDNIIEVSENGEEHLNKKYVNGQFIDAPIIKYAFLNGNTVDKIETTIFSSEVNGPIVTSEEVDTRWTWDGSNFIAPISYNPVEIVIVDPFPVFEIEEPLPTGPTE